MRREDFTLDVGDIDWVENGDDPRKPRVTIDFTGDGEEFRERLTAPDGELLDDEQTDVTFRLLSPLEDEDATGVVAVTDRVTGDYILELNQDADDVLRFIRAARRYGERDDGDGQYAVTVLVDGEEFATYEKNTFLVYNADGELLRKHSLIPSGIEL